MRLLKSYFSVAALASTALTASPAHAAPFDLEGEIIQFSYNGTVEYRVDDQVVVRNPDGSTKTLPSDAFGPLTLSSLQPSLLQPGGDVAINFTVNAAGYDWGACGGRATLSNTGTFADCSLRASAVSPPLNQLTGVSTSSGGFGTINPSLEGLTITRNPDTFAYSLESRDGEFLFAGAHIPDYQYNSFTELLEGSAADCVQSTKCNFDSGSGTFDKISFPLNIRGDAIDGIGGYDAGTAGFLDIIGSFSLPVTTTTQVSAPGMALLFGFGAGIVALRRKWARFR